MITRQRLRELERAARGCRIAVFGDLILDEFLTGTVERISPEAPVPVLRYSSHSYALGGAGNAARTVAGLGADAALVGAVGNDQAGQAFVLEAGERGVDVTGVVAAPRRTTTLKTRVVAQAQQVVRVDREAEGPLGAAATGALRAAALAAAGAADAVLISDYDKGGVPAGIAREVIAEARRRRSPVLVDSKAGHTAYRGADVLTPNLAELAHISRVAVRNERDLERAARAVFKRLAPRALLVTRAEHGMSLFDGPDHRIDIPALASEVHDVTGAGDTVAASLALALAAGSDLVEAARFATLAAAVVVRKVGTAAPEWDELAALAEA